MLSRSLPLALLLALVVALGGCGAKEEGATGAGGTALATAPVDNDLGLLVPADADALLYVPDMAGLLKKVQGAVSIFDADTASEIEMSKMLAELPIGDLVDTGKPMAMSVKLTADGGEPTPLLILPTTDVAAVQARVKEQGMGELPASGAYVSMLMGPGQAPAKADSPSAIVQDLPTGDLVVRANLASLRETFADQIDGAFDEMGREMDRNLPKGGPLDMSGFMDSMTKGMKTFLDSAEGLDIVLNVQGGMVDVKGLLSVKAGSALDGMAKGTADVSGLADRLPGGFPIAILFSGDMYDMPEWLEELIEGLLEAYPEDLARLMKASMDKQAEFKGILGNLHGAVFKIDEGGMAFSAVSKVEDADAYFKAWEGYYQDKEMTELLAKLGMEMDMLPPTTVAGVEVRHQRMTMDMQKLMQNFAPGEEMPPEATQMMNDVIGKLFGEDGMVINTAAVDGYVVTTMGGGQALLESAIGAAKGSSTMKAGLEKAMTTAGGSPSFLVYLDGRAIAKGVLGFAKHVMPEEQAGDIPTAPDGNPVPLVFYGGAGGRTYMGGFSIDLQSIKDLIDDFMK